MAKNDVLAPSQSETGEPDVNILTTESNAEPPSESKETFDDVIEGIHTDDWWSPGVTKKNKKKNKAHMVGLLKRHE